MNLPKTLRIGREKYEVQQVRKLRGCAGDIDLMRNRIRIALQNCLDEKYKSTEKMSTLLHEILHGVFYEMGERELCDDEKFILKFERYFAPIFLQILKEGEKLQCSGATRR